MYFNSPAGARDRSKSKGINAGGENNLKQPGKRSDSKKKQLGLPPRPDQILENMGIEEILKRAMEEQDRLQRHEKTPPLVTNADAGLSYGARLSNQRGISPSAGPKQNQPGTKDSDLMTSLLKRVSTLEKQLDLYKRELKEKSIEALDLKDKLKTYELVISEKQIGQEEISAVENLKEQNSRLIDELEEIKEYLADHGVIWKGSKTSAEGKLELKQIRDELSAKKPSYFESFKQVQLRSTQRNRSRGGCDESGRTKLYHQERRPPQ
jgi:hypothetical protein